MWLLLGVRVNLRALVQGCWSRIRTSMTCVCDVGEEGRALLLCTITRVGLQGPHVRFIVFKSAFIVCIFSFAVTSLNAVAVQWSLSRTLPVRFKLYQVPCLRSEPARYFCSDRKPAPLKTRLLFALRMRRRGSVCSDIGVLWLFLMNMSRSNLLHTCAVLGYLSLYGMQSMV